MNLFVRLIEPSQKYQKGGQLFSNEDLRKMIVPLLIEQALQLVVGMMDTMMVSYAGEAAVSGVSLDTMLYVIFMNLFTAVATGGSVVISQYLGRQDKDNADLSASQVIRISAVFSILCMVLILLTGNWILKVLYGSAEADVMAACRTYLRIVTLSFPGNALYNAGAAIYRSMGRTKTTMKVSMTMNAVNIIGNAVGIFVLHAGAAGVAWPTTISWSFAAVVMMVLCFRSKHEVRIRWNKILRLDFAMRKRILHIAVPNGIEGGLFQASKVFIGTLIATYGTYQIAANGISQTIWSLSALSSVAMSPVFVTVIGQCMGAKDIDAAEYYMHKLTRLSLIMGFVWNIFILAILPLLVRVYQVSDITRNLILICVAIHAAAAAFVHPFAFPLSGGLRASGDVKFTLYSSIFTSVFLRALLSYILGTLLGMGIIGVTLAMVSDWIVKGAMDYVRLLRGRWKTKKVI